MESALQGILAFDRFTLDLTRGCLRAGPDDIELRPKAFNLLCYFAGNAGRLILKRELLDAVWGNAAVSDESLVQCIRELRQKLGDDSHRLIRNVPRRGYLFDVQVMRHAAPVPAAPASAAADGVSAAPPRAGIAWAAGLLLAAVCTASGFVAYPRWAVERPSLPQSIELPDAVRQRLTVLTTEKELPIPQFQLREPAVDVPNNTRRFVGIWVSNDGWAISKRQLMMIVTDVDRDGAASGYLVNGPAKRGSRVAGPAFSARFTGRIFDRVLHYDGRLGMGIAALTPENRIEYRLTFVDGGDSIIVLEPVWRWRDLRDLGASPPLRNGEAL